MSNSGIIPGLSAIRVGYIIEKGNKANKILNKEIYPGINNKIFNKLNNIIEKMIASGKSDGAIKAELKGFLVDIMLEELIQKFSNLKSLERDIKKELKNAIKSKKSKDDIIEDLIVLLRYKEVSSSDIKEIEKWLKEKIEYLLSGFNSVDTRLTLQINSKLRDANREKIYSGSENIEMVMRYFIAEGMTENQILPALFQTMNEYKSDDLIKKYNECVEQMNNFLKEFLKKYGNTIKIKYKDNIILLIKRFFENQGESELDTGRCSFEYIKDGEIVRVITENGISILAKYCMKHPELCVLSNSDKFRGYQKVVVPSNTGNTNKELGRRIPMELENRG